MSATSCPAWINPRKLRLVLAMALCMASLAYGSAWATQQRGLVSVLTPEQQNLALYQASYALVIGVSRYTAGWPNLESVEQETQEVARALKEHGFQVILAEHTDSQGVNKAFEDFINRYGYNPGNRLLIYFAGHGHTRQQGRKGYLVPSDAPDPQRDEAGFLRKALSMDDIMAWARKMEAKHVLFLFDSCFAGTVFKSREMPVPRHISSLTAKPVRQFISAGGAGETVPARSFFTPSFIRGIAGEADRNGDGYVTGTELGLYLHDKVIDYGCGQTPQFGKIKDPDLDEGDFVFVVPGGGRTGGGVSTAGAPTSADRQTDPQNSGSLRPPQTQVARPDQEAEEVQAAAQGLGQAPAGPKQKIIYHVKHGDSLFTIAARHQVTKENLIRWNRLKAWRPVLIGQPLIIYK